MTRILFCHDSEGMAEVKAELLSVMGYPTEGLDTIRGTFTRIARGLQHIDTVILHKDFGQYSGENIPNAVDRIVQLVRDVDESIRIGIVSGEFPYGKGRVLRLGADFYYETRVPIGDKWFLAQLEKGPVTPQEITKRGKEISMPDQTGLTGERKY